MPPDTERVSYRRPGFFSKFFELNKVMWDVNKGLTASHPYDSRPEVSSCTGDDNEQSLTFIKRRGLC